MAVFGAEVSVSAWSAWEVLAQAVKAGHYPMPVGMLDKNAGVSG